MDKADRSKCGDYTPGRLVFERGMFARKHVLLTTQQLVDLGYDMNMGWYSMMTPASNAGADKVGYRTEIKRPWVYPRASFVGD
jgi:hypothetical protein